MERRDCSAFCFGCGGGLTPSSSTLPSLLLSVTSGGGRREARAGGREGEVGGREGGVREVGEGVRER